MTFQYEETLTHAVDIRLIEIHSEAFAFPISYSFSNTSLDKDSPL